MPTQFHTAHLSPLTETIPDSPMPARPVHVLPSMIAPSASEGHAQTPLATPDLSLTLWVGLARRATLGQMSLIGLVALLSGVCIPPLPVQAQTPIVTQEPQPLSFQADIRPLLSDHCFQCHGPDENAREADLRLDRREEATADRGGYRVIEPGDVDASEFIRRILTDDEDEQMPPPSANKPLSDEQRQRLAAWVKQGAPYEPHWAFVPPQHPDVPELDALGAASQWENNPIDRFVLARMKLHQLSPSPPAPRETLARRVSLDLIGLPPDPQALQEYLTDDQPGAYERFVDRLLASPHYGERWARPWLDLARYSDTNGYEKDLPRSVWPYRDWVIAALNDDMPFDQFTIEQLAGDMLPNASPRQKIATGFHRNTMTNQEGGVDPQEFRFLSIVDRVSTTGTTWMGLTIGCAQCHSHKFDPISQNEYYQLFAIFNNADEPRMELHPEAIAAERAAIEAKIAKLEAELPQHYPVATATDESSSQKVSSQDTSEAFEQAFTKWLNDVTAEANDWEVPAPQHVSSNRPIVEVLADRSILATGDVTKSDEFTVDVETDLSRLTAVRLEVIPDARLPYGGPGRSSIQAGVEKGGDFYLSHFELYQVNEDGEVTRIEWGKATHSYAGPNRSAAEAIDGRTDTAWGVANRTAQPHHAVFELKKPLVAATQTPLNLRFVLRHESFYPAGLGRFRLALTSDAQVHPAHDRIATMEDAIVHRIYRDDAQVRQELRDYFCRTTPALAEARKPIDQLRQTLPAWPTSLVMAERATEHQRETHRHHRGEYLQPREAVEPGVPEVLHDSNDAINDRLSFARWLVNGEHPLTARVIMNRHWHQFFGRGLVKTVEDFGYQGAAPTHPLLLDWLATEFVQQGWSLKSMHRLIVTSQTYRQSSNVTEAQLQTDPENRWLARSPRVRLQAEQIRDAALRAADLLCERMEGPAVFPPQPPGITEATYSPMLWHVSTGGDRYRRGIYTFSKRTAPYAMFSLFDTPSGEACVAKRDRSNTPLQALTLLNDEVLVEAARELAHTAYAPDRSPAEIIESMFLRSLQRRPQPTEVELVLDFYEQQHERFQTEIAQADRIADSGFVDILGIRVPSKEARPPYVSEPEVRQLASWTLVARSLLNLDEFIMRP